MIRRVVTVQILGCLLLLFTSFFLFPLSAQEVLSVGRSYRSLAMGNTGVASANDSSAIFYNPAVLANVEGWWLDYGSWTAEVSEGFSNEEAALILAAPSYPYVNRDGLSDDNKETFLSKETPYLRANAGITLSANVFKEGFSIAGTYLIETIITTTSDGNYVYQRDDLIKKYGMSIPFGKGQFVLGLARSDILRRVAMDASSDSESSWGSQNSGTGYDIGLLYRMANKARITWGLVAYNYGDMEFSSEIKDEQSYAFGMSMNHDLGFFRIIPAIDIREINSSAAKQNTLHAGLEIGMFPNDTGGSYFNYRIGYNQGYATSGAELNLFNRSMVVGYANYGEEVGEEDAKVESRRTVYYFSLGF